MKKPTKEQLQTWSIRALLTIPALCIGLGIALWHFIYPILQVLRIDIFCVRIINPVVVLWSSKKPPQ